MKVLVIGNGAMGRNHVRVYSENHRVDQVIVYDTLPESLESVRKVQKTRAFSDLGKALAEKPDCAVVAVPTKYHYEIALKVLDAKIPLLVEKPITESLDEGKKLVEKAERQNALLLAGHIERFNPAVQALKRNLHLIGELFYASAHRFGVPTQRDVGDSFLDQAVHDIDVISFLYGKPPKEVSAIERKIVDAKSNDLCSALFEFDGFTATVEANRVTPIKNRDLILLGTKGAAKLDYITQDLTIFMSDNLDTKFSSFDEIVLRVGRGTEVKPYFVKDEPLRVEANHFLDCVEGKAKPMISGREALYAVAAAQAGQKSAKEGKKEKISV
ncbi:MAG: Gfo/Idh/MocA family oxidoreductase [Candidatus Norongarragalinales archaeon]